LGTLIYEADKRIFHFFFIYTTKLIFQTYFYFYFPSFNLVAKKYSLVEKYWMFVYHIPTSLNCAYGDTYKLREFWIYLKIKTINASSEIHSY